MVLPRPEPRCCCCSAATLPPRFCLSLPAARVAGCPNMQFDWRGFNSEAPEIHFLQIIISSENLRALPEPALRPETLRSEPTFRATGFSSRLGPSNTMVA